MKKQSSKGIRKTCALCLLAGALFFAPPMRPAHAQQTVFDPGNFAAQAAAFLAETAAMVAEHAQQVVINGAIEAYNLLVKLKFEFLSSEKEKAAFAEETARKAKMENKVRLHEAKQEAKTATDTAVRIGQMAAETVETGAESYLARQFLLANTTPTLDEFQKEVENFIALMIKSRTRGVNWMGISPKAAWLNHLVRCKYGYGSAIDGYPTNCISDNEKLRDADVLPIREDMDLEFPALKIEERDENGEKVKYVVFEPANDEQALWYAKMHYIINIAGPRPGPPSGANLLKTDSGMRDMGIFGTAQSRDSAFIHAFAKKLAYYTRPNDSTEDMKTLREHLNKRCALTRGADGGDGIFSAEQITNFFHDCTKGLSAYQLDYINNAMCKNPTHYLAQAIDGAKPFKMSDSTIQCSKNYNLWRQSLLVRERALIDGINIIHNNKGLWSQMGSARMAGWDWKNDPAGTGYALVHGKQALPLPAVIKEAKAPLFEGEKQQVRKVPVGVPFVLDSDGLPSTLAP
ncbi:MAG: hypothetical protein FWF24_00635 [Alphaproteobacteria bacterium]|nr:hypothetical protein [Alphaproteobacteria bacterium]